VLFGFVAAHMGYTVSFAMIGLCSLATAMLLAFSVKETVTRESFSAVPSAESADANSAAAKWATRNTRQVRRGVQLSFETAAHCSARAAVGTIRLVAANAR
jgi:hypothetical protein